MPVYNGELFLKEAIDSILNQTYSDFELIILNDGSTDRTEQIILSYSDPRIRYVKNSVNLQIVETLNRGIDLAKGKYIARMDADDISLTHRFEKQVNFLEQHKDISVCGSKIRRFYDGKLWKSKSYPEYSNRIRATLLIECAVAHPTVMVRREFFESNIYDSEFNKAEDYALWALGEQSSKFHNLPEILLHYRLHEGQTLSLPQKNAANRVRAILIKKLTDNQMSDSKISLFCQIANLEDVDISEADDIMCKLIDFNMNTDLYDNEVLESVFAQQFWQLVKVSPQKSFSFYLKYRNSKLYSKISIPLTVSIKFFFRCLFRSKKR